ncbi:MAG: nuclear transport factor 2 family protein [Actinomycetota bacterium]|nr:nuclear transport factor 2 family protein [Actinomycetota bacterium]
MDVRELIDRAEISDVLARYARGVDRGDWELVRACYHADAHDDHGLYQGDLDGLLEFLQALAEQLVSTTHHLGNQLIELDGDHAQAETSCLGWYRRLDRTGAERSVTQGLRYLDRMEQRDGRWAITERVVVLDWEHAFVAGRPSLVGEGWQRGSRDTTDPSYDVLTQQMERLG